MSKVMHGMVKKIIIYHFNISWTPQHNTNNFYNSYNFSYLFLFFSSLLWRWIMCVVRFSSLIIHHCIIIMVWISTGKRHTQRESIVFAIRFVFMNISVLFKLDECWLVDIYTAISSPSTVFNSFFTRNNLIAHI